MSSKQDEDESKSNAALDAAKEKMANHRLMVVDSKHGDQSIVCMNSETMQGLAVTPLDENGVPDEDMMEEFFDDDYVEIVGHLKLRGVALLMTDESLQDGEIAIPKMLRENLKVKLGTKEFPDYVMVYGIMNSGLIKSLTVQPIKESMEGLKTDLASLKSILDAHFDEFSSESKWRSAWKGQILTVKTGMGREAMFKVTTCDDGVYVNIGGGTNLTIGPPLSDDDAMKQFNEVGYSDIGGLKNQLDKIREVVELPIRHPTLFRRIGVRPPKGVLMHGPPGCGKTMIARAIAHETGAFFILVNGPEIVSGVAGESEKNLRSVFEAAEEKAPAIIFIDEIDAIAPNRDQVNDEAMQRIVATLLTAMDGLKSGNHVMVIGATNRPNSIDPALRRSGRFDTEIVIPVPSREARLEILQIVTRKQKKADDVDLDKLAEICTGYVGADLANLGTKAAIHCIRRCAKGIIDMDEEDIPPAFLNSLRITMQDYMDAHKATGPSLTRDVVVETPSTTFADIGGLEAVKKELQEMIAMPYLHSEFFDDMNILPPKGALLYGPPGCGKTLLAKAIAAECKANFISVKGPQLLSKWIGESESNVRDYFNKARQAAPCVLFFDELDSIAAKRGQSSGNMTDKVVNQLLTEMDGMGERGNVFIIGATNRPDTMDPAILRTGRLDQMIFIPMPDKISRLSIFRALLRKADVSPRVNFLKLADMTQKFSGADIAGIIGMATKVDMRRRIEEIQRIMSELQKETPTLSNKKALRQAKKIFRKGKKKWYMQADCFEVAFKNTSRSISDADLLMYSKHATNLQRSIGKASQLTTTTEDGPKGPDLMKKKVDDTVAADDAEDEDMSDIYG